MFLFIIEMSFASYNCQIRAGGGTTGNFSGFKYRLPYHNFTNANLIILGILQRLLSASQPGRAVICYFERDCETPLLSGVRILFHPFQRAKMFIFLVNIFSSFIKKYIYVEGQLPKAHFRCFPILST